jgi:diguanylate cyclase (GGDEF)-like protein
MTEDALTPYEALVAFLYQVPFGLLETALDGGVRMANPMAVQLLMPLAAGGALDNLFDALQAVAPALRAQAAALPVDPAQPGLSLRLAALAAPVLALRIVRLDADQLMVSVNDVTQAEAQERERLAAHVHDVQRTDALTALPNRQAVLDVLRRRLAGPADARAPLALLLLNLDRFERINTRLGAEAGDAVIREVALRLDASLRRPERAGPASIAARLGGDEFVVLLDGLRQPDDALRVAQRLLHALAPPCRVAGQAVHVAASVGVIAGEHMGDQPEGVLHDAALAMREAKRRNGGGVALFQPGTRDRALVTARVEHELRHALAAGQLFVVYQPIVPLAPDAALGLEALVRWRHPERGLVPPDQFIGVAESSGLIVPLGAFVLEQACRQFVSWQVQLGAAAPAKLSVNVSRAQLQWPGFERDLHELLQRTGMPPAALQLEVTESLAAQDDGVRQTLQRLKDGGLHVALDDFGTGYSSLSSLHQLPVDVVKFDRSFVHLLGSSAHHRVLVQATLMVARSLGMATVAEGVETEQQADALRRLDCGAAQGYLYARPQPAHELGDWLRARAAAEPALAQG